MVILFLLLGSIFFYGHRSATKYPDNSPKAFLESESSADGKVVVCIGDSITHGRVSFNYVDELSAMYRSKNYSFINAGINTELAYNVRQRLDEIIRCNPDFITILIGTNDVLATLNEKNAARFAKVMNLPVTPDKKGYTENLIEIINRLKQETHAKIAVLSLPPVTEAKAHAGYQRAIEYSAAIKNIARQKNVTYLALNESMVESIQKGTPKENANYKGGENTVMYQAIFSHYILRKSWDNIADDNGFLFLTDNIHLNKRGAGIVVQLINGFLENESL